MNQLNDNARFPRLFEPTPDVVYTIDAVERLTNVPRRTILIYCKHGLISTATNPMIDPEWGGFYFDQEAIQMLRSIEHLRVACGTNLTGIKLILELTKEIKRLQTVVPFWSQLNSSNSTTRKVEQ
jgi:DNA-binding transcriptional MerR regulator